MSQVVSEHGDQRTQEFMRLFTTHEMRLRAFAMSMIGNYVDAEDVLQQTNLVLWKRFDQFEPGTTFMSWAGRILYLVALDYKKKQKRARLQFGEAFIVAIANASSREEFTETLRDQERVLGGCISKLKAQHQEMLRVRYTDGISVEQMSVMYKKSVESIYKLLSRTRRILQDCVRLQLGSEAVHGK